VPRAPGRPREPLLSQHLSPARVVAIILAAAVSAVFAVPAPADAASAVARGVRIAAVARAQVGDPYGYGASGPHAFDCSGLVMYSFFRAVGRRLPHNAARLSALGRPISRRNARPGDVAYWGPRGSAFHVGIVVAVRPVRVVDAPYSGARVQVRRPWSGVRFVRLVRP
jgi:cell wall-associated NlpC family hydrolase